MGDYKKKMLEYLVKISKNPEIKSLGVEGLAALLTGQNIKNAVKRSGGNFLINLFIIMMIVLQAFFPKIATYTTIIIAVIFIIALVAIAFALLGSGGTSTMLIGDAIMNFLIPVFILFVVSIFIKLIGSPNYYNYIYKNVNPIAALFSLLIALGIGMAIAKSSGSKFILGSFAYALALFTIIPVFIALFSENPWGLCVKLPFLPDYCNPKETIVNSVSYVSIPTTGGIREVAKEVDEILIATDADAEGEKIGWDIAMYLRPFNRKIKRLEFHEITKRAILHALDNPRKMNENLVRAQIVRRIEDRWIGFELSQKLQKKFKRRSLSAGRVQTPVLGWVVQRTLGLKESIVNFFEVELENGVRIVFEKKHVDNVVEFMKKLENSKLIVKKIEEKEDEVNPYPPYTTDAMLKDAASILRLSAPETMALAQNLFELGLITYHRTDSTRISNVGISIAREYITESISRDLFKARNWSTREGAHECIRPTRPFDTERLIELIKLGILQLPMRLTRNHYRLYDLIFRRFMASQMKPAKVVKTKYKFILDGLEKEEEHISKIIDEGFTKFIQLRTLDLDEDEYSVVNVRHWKAPKLPLYTQADLIALMKERKIGRPSTYAKIISTLFERRYIKQNAKGRISFTKLGLVVYRYLSEKFGEFISEDVTRGLQEIMDEIEEGKKDYLEVLRSLYWGIGRLKSIE